MTTELERLTTTTPVVEGDYGGCCPPSVDKVNGNNNHEKEEPKVTTLELFSDLVIVVAIHIVAEPLEESQQANHVPNTMFLWYLIRVFMLWLVWQGDMIFMNAATVFRRATCPLHYVVVFAWMALVLNMTQAFAQSHHKGAISIFLILRAIEVFCYVKQVGEQVPSFVPLERVNNLRSFVPPLVFTFVFCEAVPCTLAVWFQNTRGEPWLAPLIFMVIAVFVSYFIGAVLSDRRTAGKIMKDAYETDHLHERYELITLIFIGEICFAAGSPSGHESTDKFIITTAAIALAFGAYLLMFACRHGSDSAEFWSRSAKHLVTGMILFAMLFATIPMLGSGFVRILEPEQDGEEELEENYEVDHFESDSTMCNATSAHLLCYSTCSFLILSSFINLLDWDPTKEEIHGLKRIGIAGRVSLRMTCGLLVLLLVIPRLESTIGCLGGIPTATLLCPILCLVSAMWESWAVGSMQWSQWTSWSLSFEVQM